MFKRLIKAYTLAEVLVVMSAVGIISAIMIPQMANSVNEGQYKAAYKKAYSTVANVAAVQRAKSKIVASSSVTDDDIYRFWKELEKNLDIESYVNPGNAPINDGKVVKTADIHGGIVYMDKQCGDANDNATHIASGYVIQTNHVTTPWLVTTDGMAYAIARGGSCGKKSAINGPELTVSDAMANSCFVVIVDTNGLKNLPNKIEDQVIVGAGGSATANTLKRLTGDRYYIYIGSDGAIHGPIATTLSGRIVNDLK